MDTLDSRKLAEFEQLSKLYRDSQHTDSPMSIEQLATENPELKDEILKIFPMLTLLDSPPQLEEHFSEDISEIAGYEIVGVIGSGGMGVVYEAIHEDYPDERFAIKVVVDEDLQNSYDIDQKAISRRFLREVQTISNLSHVGIVSIFESGRFQNALYFVMPFMDGGNLAELIQSYCAYADQDRPTRRLRSYRMRSQFGKSALWQIVVNVGTQAASALQYAHNKGFVHRDIKPENIMLDSTGQLCIADFGLATSLVSKGNITSSSRVVGTLRYMAPEQFAGEEDHRCDIFSLGITLYELLLSEYGIRFNGIAKMNEEGLLQPSKLKADFPIELEHVILKACSLNPNKRYQTMEKFRRALQGCYDAEVERKRNHKSSRKSDGKLISRFGISFLTVMTILALAMTLFSNKPFIKEMRSWAQNASKNLVKTPANVKQQHVSNPYVNR